MKNTITFEAIVSEITPILLSINSKITNPAIKIAVGMEEGKLLLNRVEYVKKGQSMVFTLHTSATINGVVSFLQKNNLSKLLNA